MVLGQGVMPVLIVFIVRVTGGGISVCSPPARGGFMYVCMYVCMHVCEVRARRRRLGACVVVVVIVMNLWISYSSLLFARTNRDTQKL